jgi:proteasome assembly chaperone 3
VLGGTKREEEVVGQTLAVTLASAILHKRPQEERLLVLGLGLQGLHDDKDEDEKRDWFEEVVGLCLEVLA